MVRPLEPKVLVLEGFANSDSFGYPPEEIIEIMQRIVAYAKELGIAENVLFLGKRNDIPELLSASDVFFLPSLYEGLPIVAIEAQASGLPLIISDSITHETDITGNVKFLSLDDKNETWAKYLLDAANTQRDVDVMHKISEAEYNTGNAEKTTKKITELFYKATGK